MPKRTCTIDGCDRPTVAKGLCSSHYNRWRKHGDFNVTPKQNPRNTATHKVCATCDELLPRTQFYKSTRDKDGLRGTCKPCANRANKDSYQRNREATLKRMREYSATPERKAYMEAYLADYIPAKRDDYARRSAKRRALQRDAMVDEDITIEGLKQRHGTTCEFCNVELLFNTQAKGKFNPRLATIEHMQPLSRGGKHSWDNTTLACHRCNTRKNSRTPDEYMEWLQRDTVA